MLRRALKLSLIALAVIAVLIVAGGVYARSQVRASLPQLNGTAAISGLTANVRVDRDALGVPTITGATREDVARALGFLHAQDRFFQMDLQRRQPAGELSGLDRKSTRLNSSHSQISYAVFCLKKKKRKQ